jgi:hypothetical protein
VLGREARGNCGSARLGRKPKAYSRSEQSCAGQGDPLLKCGLSGSDAPLESCDVVNEVPAGSIVGSFARHVLACGYWGRGVGATLKFARLDFCTNVEVIRLSTTGPSIEHMTF